jgi:hypothetical protein
VRVPDAALKCVGFIGEVNYQDATGIYGEHQASGFFVSMRCESPQLREDRFTYFITAKHVAEKYEDRDYCLWVNKKHGGVTTVPDVIGERWWLHPTDETADVVAIQVALGPDCDIVPIALETIGIPQRLKHLNVGIGDEVFAVGLFTEVDSTEAMKPIVRHGNIAMMPPTQIQTKYGYADVILVEARSIGGISGSPVFARHTLVQKVKMGDGTSKNSFSNAHAELLLGLVHGHWDIREQDINKTEIDQDREHGVNYGIAIVVPAIKIYEILYREELIAMRKQQEREEVQRGIPGTDMAVSKNPKKVFTKENFETALKKASRKITSKT